MEAGSAYNTNKPFRFRFSAGYFLLMILLFGVEVLIALFLTDAFIRPYGGDYLVVILLYAFLRAFTNLPVIKTAVFVLAFACFIEVAQYFDAVLLLGLEKNAVARTVIGHSFEWLDILAYIAGVVTVILVERWRGAN